MSSWRDAILNDFVPDVSKLTLVADPDNLLTEERLALELRQRGFELIEKVWYSPRCFFSFIGLIFDSTSHWTRLV